MPRVIRPAERERRAQVKEAARQVKEERRIQRQRQKCACTGNLSKDDLKSGHSACKMCRQTSEHNEHFKQLEHWMHRK